MLILEDGTKLMIPATVKVERQALQPGAEVKVSYEDQGSQKIVTSIEVPPAHDELHDRGHHPPRWRFSGQVYLIAVSRQTHSRAIRHQPQHIQDRAGAERGVQVSGGVHPPAIVPLRSLPDDNALPRGGESSRPRRSSAMRKEAVAQHRVPLT